MLKREQLLRWHGSKRQLAPKIVALFPKGYEDLAYVEPFCGSASVFYSKRPSKVEVLNDLDEELLNFLMIVKFHPRELAHTVRLLPNSRALFARWMDRTESWSPIIRAARFCYLSHVSFGGLRDYWAPEGRSLKASHLHKLPMRFYRWSVRLARATLECAPWQEVIEKYDSPQALFYVDPPYLGTQGYQAGEFSESNWRELRAVLAAIKGNFVLSTEGTATMKLLWRGFRQRLASVRSSLGPKDRIQKELLVWNYDLRSMSASSRNAVRQG